MKYIDRTARALVHQVSLHLSDLLVNVKDFGARGDGITNDTKSIQSSIDYVSSKNGGIVYLPPNGIYMFSSLNVPKNVTLKMAYLLTDYSFTDANLSKEFYGLKRILSSVGVGLINYGKLENININGNYDNSNDYMVENHGNIDGLFITKAFNAIHLYSGNVAHLLCYGNQNNALVVSACDFVVSDFSIASNNGHGMVGESLATGIFINGRFEWNGKNNVIVSYANELLFTNVIIDAANWFNIYSIGQFTAVSFNNCLFLGSHRRYASVPSENSNFYSMFIFLNNATQVIFSNCTFEASSDPTKEHYNSILTYVHQYMSKAINFDNCTLNSVPIYLDPKSASAANANIYVTGTSFEANPTDDTMKRYNKGSLTVIPETDSATIDTFNPFIKTGVTIYDWQRKKLLINLWGTFYDVLGNSPSFSFGALQSVLSSSTLSNCQTINISALGTGLYVVCVIFGGTSNASYSYLGLFTCVLSKVLTDINKSSQLTVLYSNNVISITSTDTLKSGHLQIYKLI